MSKAKANRKNQPAQPQGSEVLAEMGASPELVEAMKAVESPDEQNIDVEGPIVIQPTAEELIAKHGNKSNAIRALAAEGKTRSETAKLLGIRYQHVNNVLGQILKREIKKEREAANKPTDEAAAVES
jgi:hypothetical protein